MICVNYWHIYEPICVNYFHIYEPICVNYWHIYEPICVNYWHIYEPICVNYWHIYEPIFAYLFRCQTQLKAFANTEDSDETARNTPSLLKFALFAT